MTKKDPSFRRLVIEAKVEQINPDESRWTSYDNLAKLELTVELGQSFDSNQLGWLVENIVSRLAAAYTPVIPLLPVPEEEEDPSPSRTGDDDLLATAGPS